MAGDTLSRIREAATLIGTEAPASEAAGRPPTPSEWIAVRLALTTAFHSAKDAVTLVYEGLGTTGVYRKSPLDRQLRDVHQ
ncbi:MAG TPA: hypothetical protein VEG38_09145 [Acidimicrobiia bacterium]|nr:hypothetical protein [Acidimicrobiia bacterium]